MSATTRQHRPTHASPRYTKRHGIGRDRVFWPASAGTYHRGMQPTTPGPSATGPESPVSPPLPLGGGDRVEGGAS